MAGQSSVRVEGLERAIRQLEGFGVALTDLKDAFAQIAREAIPTYQQRTPVRSGTLRGDYRAGRTKNRVVLYVGRASVPYARVINYGWPARNIRAADFVAKGDAIEGPKALAAIETSIDRLIRSMT